jgi:fructokinase
MTSARFVVVGEALVDMVSDASDSAPRSSPGGSPANVAHALARLGHGVSFAAR